jgi:8-oxo-dGTP pyrophosphatase MutT (NUDIX family)
MARDDDQPRARISLGNGGWVRVDSEAFPGPLYLRLVQDDAGHWHTREVYLEGDDRYIEAADLRSMPLRAFETEILANGGQQWMSAHADLPAPDLGTLASYYATTFGRRAPHNWVVDSFTAQTPQGASVRARRQEPSEPMTHSPVAPLSAPGPDGLSDEFLRHVAAAYRAAVASRKQPGPELASQAGVPVRTVHRWVYIARQRGLLPRAARKRPMSKQEDLARAPIPAEEGVERPIATAIVTSDRGVLVGQRNDGRPPWTFISGEIEPGESPADAAEREVKEETTLEVEVGDLIGERTHPRTGRRMFYLAATPTRDTEIFVGDPDELADVRWVSLAEADELMKAYGMFDKVHEHLVQEIGES